MTAPAKHKVSLPETLPILPLSGVLLIPGARLPLNIFEPRYIAMLEDSLGYNRMVGLIQPSEEPNGLAPTTLYSVGCAGRITSFIETEDNRFLITLLGICRFEISEELSPQKGYRSIKPNWKKFVKDLNHAQGEIDVDRKHLIVLAQSTFRELGINADWDMILNTNNAEFIEALTMICPFAPNEKQALLEAATPSDRAKMLISLLEMASLNKNTDDRPRH